MVVGYAGVFLFIKKNTIKASGDLSQAEAQLETVRIVSGQKRIAMETANDQEAIKKYILTEETLPSFFTLLERQAQQIGVYAEIVTVDSNGGLFIDLEVDGSADQVYHYLQLLETVPVPIVVTRVSITKGRNSEEISWHGIFRVQIVGFTKS